MNFNIVKSGFSLTDNHLHLKDNLEYSKGFFDGNYHNETKRKATKIYQNINIFKTMKSIATIDILDIIGYTWIK